MQPLVSILIPCYNAEKWLAETLESALAQTWSNKEIILVNDGSTDNSLVVAKQFESNIVQVISQENQSASAARNRALAEAQGDFIQYLDADDLLSPDKIRSQVSLLQRNPIGLLTVCGTTHFFDGTSPDQGIHHDGGDYFADSDDPLGWLVQLLSGAMVHPAAWLTPRTIAEAAGNWNEELSLDDDGEYFARIVLASNGIRYSSQGISYYRKYHDYHNLSGQTSRQHQWSALKAIELKAYYILSRTSCTLAKKSLAKNYLDLAIQTYPMHAEITDICLQHIQALDVTVNLPSLPPKMKLLTRFFGWKIARRLQVFFYQWKTLFDRFS